MKLLEDFLSLNRQFCFTQYSVGKQNLKTWALAHVKGLGVILIQTLTLETDRFCGKVIISLKQVFIKN